MDMIDIREMAVKCRSKQEVYTTLTMLRNIYLPPLANVNNDYIADVLQGVKKFVYSSKVNVVKIPHIFGLRTADIVNFASEHFEVVVYIPEYKTPRYPSRSWLCNIGEISRNYELVATLIEEEFKEFVFDKMRDQEQEYRNKRQTRMNAIPEFVSLIKELEFLSRTNGCFYALVSNSRRRRQRKEEEKRKDDEHREMQITLDEQAKAIEKLQKELENFQQSPEENDDNAEKLYK